MKKQKFINDLVSFCIYVFLFPLFFSGYILRKYDKITNKSEKKEDKKENWVF